MHACSLFSDDLRLGTLHFVSPILVDFYDEVGFGFDDGAVGEADGAGVLHLTVADDQLEDSALFSRYAEPRLKKSRVEFLGALEFILSFI